MKDSIRTNTSDIENFCKYWSDLQKSDPVQAERERNEMFATLLSEGVGVVSPENMEWLQKCTTAKRSDFNGSETEYLASITLTSMKALMPMADQLTDLEVMKTLYIGTKKKGSSLGGEEAIALLVKK